MCLQDRRSTPRLPSRSALPPIAICVPVRNEASELPRLFDALDRLDGFGAGAVHLCLLLDGCTDASGTLAAAYRDRSRFAVHCREVAPSPANAGRARRRAMAMGLSALDRRDGLLLTTDADSQPAPDWLAAMTAALGHADIVAGRIVRRAAATHAVQDRLERYLDALFAFRRRLDPVPWEAARTHHCAGGANLGMRAPAYGALGGFAPLPCGEDARLVDDAARAGLRVRRDAAATVRTSDRRDGRATGGLAQALRHHDGLDAAAVGVAHPHDAAWQYRMHAAARAAFGEDRPEAVAAAIGLSRDHARGVARDCPNAEAFAMRIVPVPPGGMRSVALPVAEAALAALIDARAAA